MAQMVHGWNEGEDRMHKILRVPYQENPTKPGLSYHAQLLLHRSTLLALGVIDERGRPWTALLGGETGFARSLGQSIIGVKALADVKHDPALQTVLQQRRNEVDNNDDVGLKKQEFSALGIHLATRDRVKLQGKLLGAGTVNPDEHINEIQIALAVTGSLGNCPKYLNKKDIILSSPKPTLLSDSLPLSVAALTLLSKADTFFITSHQPASMSTNHRGGPPGLIRVLQNDDDACILVYPEYSGNRLYQTLGNLILDPKAGVTIPDFETGNVLYLTGTTKILHGDSASATLPRSNLAVQFLVTGAKLVQNGLAFRATPGEPSPYNPPVRYLPSERPPKTQAELPSQQATATLLSRDRLTSTIARFRFKLSNPMSWSAGQYVALNFDAELSGGYAHMNDEDPRALNDDYVRTFTVSSAPPPRNSKADEFEITIRNVGKVTDFLFKVNTRAGLEVPVLGFAGEFVVTQQERTPDPKIPFVAGGIGITPLLAQAGSLDLEKTKLFWSVGVRDLGLVVDTLRRYPGLVSATSVYVTGSGEVSGDAVQELSRMGAKVIERRLLEADFGHQDGLGDRWYICAGPALRKSLLSWLADREVVYEDFDY